jgi:hypothetical protein
MRDVALLFIQFVANLAGLLGVLRKKSVRDKFVGENLRETLACSH